MTTDAVLANLAPLLAPFCYGQPDIETYQPPLMIRVGLALRPAEGAEQGVAACRAALFESAQQAIAAVEAAGYRHMDAPRMEIGGSSFGGHEPAIVAEGVLRLGLLPPDGEPR